MTIRIIAFMVGLSISIPTLTYSHDVGDTDADWYNSLLNDSGESCCNRSKDCLTIGSADYRSSTISGEAFEANIEGKWIGVPKSSVITRGDNPTGKPVACIGHTEGDPFIRCFILPSEG